VPVGETDAEGGTEGCRLLDGIAEAEGAKEGVFDNDGSIDDEGNVDGMGKGAVEGNMDGGEGSTKNATVSILLWPTPSSVVFANNHSPSVTLVALPKAMVLEGSDSAEVEDGASLILRLSSSSFKLLGITHSITK